MKKVMLGLSSAALVTLYSMAAFAQDAAAVAGSNNFDKSSWAFVAAGLAIGIAAFGGALGQGRVAAAALEGIALQVMDILTAQLGQTALQVEDSVTRVCRSFTNIARRSSEGAARMAVQTDEEAMATARETIAMLLGRMDQAREATNDALETFHRIENIASQVDQIQRSLNKVDAVSHSLRLLALNARMEAARAGEHGRAFGVVAFETATMANSIGETAKSIHEMVDSLWREVRGSTERMKRGLINQESASDFSRVTELSRKEGSRALEILASADAAMRSQVREAAGNSQRLAKDIGEAMTALQFQDSVNQQIEHVIAALTETGDVLKSSDRDRASHLLERLRSRLSMKSEREIADRVTERNGGHSEDAGTAIELF